MAVLDRQRLAVLTEQLGDAAVVHEILQIFLQELPQRREQLTAGYAERDLHRVRIAAHTLAGASATVGAADLHQACRDLEEHLLTVGDPATVEALVRRCVARTHAAATALAGWLDGSGEATAPEQPQRQGSNR